ncbi:MAG: DUF1772 domain-containing protein [Saprospiraceae bacterium]|nr:DUF1772 domain-containing protein [Saprospiraceae bacterium]
MSKRTLLWLNAFFACGHFTGHLFDRLVVVPNWNAGTVDGIMAFHNFFQNADPGAYFSIFVMAPTLFAILSFLAYLRSHTNLKKVLAIGLIITLCSTASTFLFFFPINNYLFWGKDIVLDPAQTSTLVTRWVFGEWFRIVAGLVTMILAGWAIHLSYKNEQA